MPNEAVMAAQIMPLAAVIDIGSSAIRMDIGQVGPDGLVKIFESLHQEVGLGRDVFVAGAISLKSVEACVQALSGFQQVMCEYRIESPRYVRVVATSAVREAGNRDLLTDRIYIATGLPVEVADAAEVHRYIYLAGLPFLKNYEQIGRGNVIFLEVGGGNTELLLFDAGRMSYANSYRLGSFRMRETIETHESGEIHLLAAMEDQIQRTVSDVKHRMAARKKPALLVIGGDIRFAATCLYPDWKRHGLLSISLFRLEELTKSILGLSVDELVRKHHVTYTEAETLGPALLTYVRIAGGLGLKEVFAAPVSMRDGVIAELAGNAWAEDLNAQIVQAAINLGLKYDFDQAHALHVEHLCRVLFRSLKPLHKLADRYEQVLALAAVLHDIGAFVNSQSHHKHSMYLISNSNLFGVGAHMLRLIAVLARYHRRAMPKAGHEEYRVLTRDDQMIVAGLAAILRVADALDRGHAQRIRDIKISLSEKFVAISVPNVAEAIIEQMALAQKGQMFLNIFGKTVVLKTARVVKHG